MHARTHALPLAHSLLSHSLTPFPAPPLPPLRAQSHRRRREPEPTQTPAPPSRAGSAGRVPLTCSGGAQGHGGAGALQGSDAQLLPGRRRRHHRLRPVQPQDLRPCAPCRPHPGSSAPPRAPRGELPGRADFVKRRGFGFRGGLSHPRPRRARAHRGARGADCEEWLQDARDLASSGVVTALVAPAPAPAPAVSTGGGGGGREGIDAGVSPSTGGGTRRVRLVRG